MNLLRICWAIAIVFAFGLILGHYTSAAAVAVVAGVLFGGSAAYYGVSAFYSWWDRTLSKGRVDGERDVIRAQARAWKRACDKRRKP